MPADAAPADVTDRCAACGSPTAPSDDACPGCATPRWRVCACGATASFLEPACVCGARIAARADARVGRRRRNQLRAGALILAAAAGVAILRTRQTSDGALWTAADAAMRGGRAAEAVTFLDAILLRHPADVPARRSRGIALALIGRSSDAEAELRALLQEGDRSFDTRLWLARLALERGAPGEAKLLATPALSGDVAATAAAHQVIGLALARTGGSNRRDVLAHLRAAQSSNLLPPDAQVQLLEFESEIPVGAAGWRAPTARAASAAGLLRELQGLASGEPGDPAAVILAARALAAVGQTDGARAQLNRLPPAARAWRDAAQLVARLEFDAGNVFAAESALTAWVSADRTPAARAAAARILHANGRSTAALALVAPADGSDANDIELLLARGEILAALGRAGEAEPLVRAARGTKPDSRLDRLLANLVRAKPSGHEEARRILSDVVARRDDGGEGAVILADLLVTMANAAATPEARAALLGEARALVAQMDGLSAAPTLSGRIALAEGRLDEARKHFGEAQEAAPRSAAPWMFLAHVEMLRGDARAQLRALAAAADRGARGVDVTVQRAEAALRAGMTQYAAQVARDAVATDPENASARIALAAATATGPEPDFAAATQALEPVLRASNADDALRGVLAATDIDDRMAGTVLSPQSRRRWGEFLARHPASAEGRLRFAQVLAGVGEGAAAREQTAIVLAENPSDRRALRISLASFLRADRIAFDDEGAAARLLAELRRVAPGTAECAWAEGLCATAAGEFPRAREFLTEATRLAPADAQAHLLLGAAQAECGDTELAAQSMRTALALDPRLAAARSSLVRFAQFDAGRAALRGDADAAIEGARAAAGTGTSHLRTRGLLVHTLFEVARRGNAHLLPEVRARAEACLADSVSAEERALAHGVLADVCLAQGDTATALVLRREHAAIAPNDVRALAALASAASQAGLHEECLATARRILAIDPRSALAVHFASVSLGKLGDTIAALKVASDAVAACPDSAPLWVEAAAARERLGDARGAADAYLRGVESARPGEDVFVVALDGFVRASGAAGDLAAADERVTALLARDEWKAELLFHRGVGRIAAGRIDDGRADLLAALTAGFRSSAHHVACVTRLLDGTLDPIDPGDAARVASRFVAAESSVASLPVPGAADPLAEALLLCGVAAERVRDMSGAMMAYHRALARSPSFHAAANNLADLCARIGRADDALRFATQATAAAPDVPEYLDTLASALHGVGRSAEALTTWERCRRLFASQAASGGAGLAAGGTLQSLARTCVRHAACLAALGRSADAVAALDAARAAWPGIDETEPYRQARVRTGARAPKR